MSTGSIAAFSIILLLVLIFSGVHLSTSLMFTSILSVFLFTGRFSTAINVLSQSAWSAVRQYMFGVIPLFVLMGLLANLSGASQDLYNSASLLLKKVRGGVGIATVVANAVFAAITGVTVASAAVFTKIALPQMLRLKYNRKVALGTISGSAILGMLIPPSLLMIVYGSQADVSIGKLFVAAVVPGIIMTVAFIIVILAAAHVRPDYIPEVEELTEYEKRKFPEDCSASLADRTAYYDYSGRHLVRILHSDGGRRRRGFWSFPHRNIQKKVQAENILGNITGGRIHIRKRLDPACIRFDLFKDAGYVRRNQSDQ